MNIVKERESSARKGYGTGSKPSKKNERKWRYSGKGITPLPPPTNAQRQMQRKYYNMRCISFQAFGITMKGGLIWK